MKNVNEEAREQAVIDGICEHMLMDDPLTLDRCSRCLLAKHLGCKKTCEAVSGNDRLVSYIALKS